MTRNGPTVAIYKFSFISEQSIVRTKYIGYYLLMFFVLTKFMDEILFIYLGFFWLIIAKHCSYKNCFFKFKLLRCQFLSRFINLLKNRYLDNVEMNNQSDLKLAEKHI